MEGGGRDQRRSHSATDGVRGVLRLLLHLRGSLFPRTILEVAKKAVVGISKLDSCIRQNWTVDFEHVIGARC